MGLTIGVSLIESGKRKRTEIINEIRRRNIELSRAKKVRTNKRLKRWWCHKIQNKQIICQGQN